ncbi:NUDIX hydrolase [Fulvivirgaceae bacterium BMA10]|uniref:NUDIX hydrolase n=1 Tax=Splendidivirga corallicola TaxID=3051826 RepID=A0ABT8KL14_9BACT|nr:NUDIX hydrolase [Fulvivirgaceae bacterium BMA10]
MKESLALKVVDKFGHQARCRVCGLYVEKNKILMIKHRGLGEKGYLWSPPGGGVIYGSSLKENLKREFLEETGLEIKVQKFLFVHEFLNNPLHAIELFFEVEKIGGEIGIGSDPEMDQKNQIIEEVKMLSFEELKLENKLNLHNILWDCQSINDLLKMRGYFNY